MARRKPNTKNNNNNRSYDRSKSNDKTSNKGTETGSRSESPDSKSQSDGTGSERSESHVGNQSTSANDPEWYKKFPELAFGAGNIPFSERLGAPTSLGNLSVTFTTNDNKYVTYNGNTINDSIPGICSVKTKPSYGFNTDLNSPLNVAASQYYTNVRYVNSGRKNYDPADLMISTMAIAELYSYINWMQRLYGYAYMYSMRNNYINEALISANGVNVTDITQHLADFRYWINSFISRVSAFAVPNDINIFRRRAFIYAHLYTESVTGNIKDQLYQFVPDGFYKFQLDSTGKGMLKYVMMSEWANTKWTLNNIISFGENLLSNISNDEDFGLITGDIIKAYGSNLIGLAPVPEALIIMPEYEEYTLSQIRNATIAPIVRASNAQSFSVDGYTGETFTSGDVMQSNNGNLVTCELLRTAIPAAMGIELPGIVTVTNPNPSIDDVLEATRLKVCAVPGSKSSITVDNRYVELYTGSDVVVGWTMSQYIVNRETRVWVLLEELIDWQWLNVTELSSIRKRLDSVHFHWAPITFTFETEISGDNITIIAVNALSNIDNYATLSVDNVQNLHEVALLSLLSVPGVAQLVG